MAFSGGLALHVDFAAWLGFFPSYAGLDDTSQTAPRSKTKHHAAVTDINRAIKRDATRRSPIELVAWADAAIRRFSRIETAAPSRGAAVPNIPSRPRSCQRLSFIVFAQLRFAAHDGDHSADTSWPRNSRGRFGNYSALTGGIVDFPEMPPSSRIWNFRSLGLFRGPQAGQRASATNRP